MTASAPEATRPRRVLFVEDEAALVQMYRRFFRGRYHMAFAGSGARARHLFSGFRPDVVVIDLQLPDTDGLEVARYIRQERPDVPIVITSAYASLVPVVKVLGLPHSGYLIKPFELAVLGTSIDAAG